MAYPDPDHLCVSAADLRDLADEVAHLYARVGMVLNAAAVDLAPATVLPSNVIRIADYRPRSTRQAVS
ncbi:hypothetical protein [Nonomuraea sp. NPDC001023]|uniref:hypothetical protein n=1 Tax=unclassified Nonomuraea TaxID=2593643 RepID=UPI00332810C7